MARTDLYGSRANKKQGTQEAPIAKRQAAQTYSRSSQRAAPTGNTTFAPSDWKADKKKRDKRMGSGKHGSSRIFP